MNKRIKKKHRKQENKKLCERYPFLIPYHRWYGKCMWESKDNWYYCSPYSYTELDAMPKGWRKAFGVQMCEEIREELIKNDSLYDYRITQIKEKYGELRWYDWGTKKGSKVWDIIDKYTELSRHICLHCGRPAEIIDNCGWLEPVCEGCQSVQNNNMKQYKMKIERRKKEKNE